MATSTSMGGKTVTVVGPAAAPEQAGVVWYSVGDIAFNISSNHPEWITEAVSLLP